MSSGMKVEFEKFDMKGSFSMWRVRVEDLLVQLGLDSALEEKPEDMTEKQWSSLEKKACSIIRDCLADEMVYGMLEERSSKGLWSRLHTIYMGKNMCNKLMLKKQLYSLRMQEGGDVVGYIQRFDQMSMNLLNLGVKMEEKKQEVQQGYVGQLTSIYDFLFTGAPGGIEFQVEHHPEVPPHVEGALAQVRGRGVQGKEQNFSTSDDDALHRLMQDVRAPERSGLEEMMSHVCVAAREGLDTYVEAEMSLRRDRWFRARTGELQSLQEKLKR